MALSLPEVTEASHMGHPDFRVANKIFATLSYPNDRFGVVMLSPQDQDLIVKDHPKTFAPVAGGWGKSGATTVVLRGASKRAVAIALEAAWRKRATHVSVLKTRPTAVSAESHIAAIANEEKRNDAKTLVALMRSVTKQEPRMWGPSIVGFGSYHYKYTSGHEGDSALAGFAARGRELVVYIAPDFEGRDALLTKLGKHKTGKVCVYIRRLANVDLKVLETLVARSVADTKRRYPQPKDGAR